MMEHLIVGIDSGKTSALACINLSGKLVRLETGRFVGLDWFIDKIKDTGSPVIIACDKKNPYGLVSKLSAIFNTILFLPSSDITVSKKMMIVDDCFRNLHERDALAAARIAYNAYANKLNQAERLANENGTNPEIVKALVVKRYSIYEAISGKRAGRR